MAPGSDPGHQSILARSRHSKEVAAPIRRYRPQLGAALYYYRCYRHEINARLQDERKLVECQSSQPFTRRLKAKRIF